MISRKLYKLLDNSSPKYAYQSSLPVTVRADGLKSLLSILKHRTVEKTVEKCELSIVEGGNMDDETQDGLESRLIICLHCKHGGYHLFRLLVINLHPTARRHKDTQTTALHSNVLNGSRYSRQCDRIVFNNRTKSYQGHD